MKTTIITVILVLNIVLNAQTNYPEINKEINEGNFSRAGMMSKDILTSPNLSLSESYNLNFEIDKMERIKLDFDRSYDDIINELKKYYATIDEKMTEAWEADKSLEMMVIDGKKKYFHNAVPNLFRKNLAAKKRKDEVDGITIDPLKVFLKTNIPAWVKESKTSGKVFANPVRMKINYTLTVHPNAVPDGEIIRCWLPYPRKDNKRQTNIKLLSVNQDEYVITDNSHDQSTMYLEKKSQKDKPTIFRFQLEYISSSEFSNIDPLHIKLYDQNSELYKEFTSERPPHIVFTDQIKKLSQQIVGNETDIYEKIKKIYTWIDDNIPWTSEREYSTIDNLSAYCINNMQGDCGIKTLTFMTLARYNGIPCRWQSGWMMHPGQVNLHDWCEIYLNGYGWVPLDQSFGFQESSDPAVKYFYIGGIDPYRMIVNKDYGNPLYPEKFYPRSETNDFQRGEVEWKGGNLYFNKWDYHMDVQYIK